MKRGISVLMVIMLLLALAAPATAAGDTLDIEKAAILSVENSQAVQSTERQLNKLRESKGNIVGMLDMMRMSLQYQSSYQTAMNIELLPMQIDDGLNQAWNTQAMITNAIRMSAYNSYISLLKAKYALDINEGLLNDFDAGYRKAKLQLPLGLISQSELRLSEISYLTAKHNYDSARKDYEAALITLNNLMGEDLDTQYTRLLDKNIKPAEQIKSLNAYLERALANRGEISNALSTLEYAEKAYEYGRAEMQQEYKFYIQQKEYEIDDARNNLELAKIDVQIDIVNNYGNLEAVMKAMEARKALKEQADISYNAAEVQYQNSQISVQQLNSAKVTRAQADIDYKSAQLDAWLVQAMMDSACDIGIYQQ